MDMIDRHWIKARLAKMERGTQKRLAEHMGIPGTTLSKIMSGVRDLQQNEIPKVLDFFNAKVVSGEGLEDDILTILHGINRLNEDGRRILQTHLSEMLRTPALLQPSESTEPNSESDPD